MGGNLLPQTGDEWMRYVERQNRAANRHSHTPSPEAIFLGRASDLLVCEGVRTVSATGVTWTNRYLVIGGGRNSTVAPGGHFVITVPANGTVIPKYGTATPGGTATVASGVIPLALYETLYYALPVGLIGNSVPENFAIVGWESTFEVPAHWLSLVRRISTASGAPEYKWTDGLTQSP